MLYLINSCIMSFYLANIGWAHNAHAHWEIFFNVLSMNHSMIQYIWVEYQLIHVPLHDDSPWPICKCTHSTFTGDWPNVVVYLQGQVLKMFTSYCIYKCAWMVITIQQNVSFTFAHLSRLPMSPIEFQWGSQRYPCQLELTCILLPQQMLSKCAYHVSPVVPFTNIDNLD